MMPMLLMLDEGERTTVNRRDESGAFMHGDRC